MSLGCAAVLGPAVGQHSVQGNLMLLEEGQHPVIQEIGGRDWRLPVIQFREPDLAVGIDERLLIDAPDALERPHIEGILGAAVARTLALEFAVGFFVRLRLLQRYDLGLRQHQPLLSHLRLQRLESFPHRLQIMPEPDTAHPSRRDGQGLLPQFIGYPQLPPGRLLDRHLHNRLFPLRRHAILQERLLAGDLLEGGLTAGLIELLETIEAVSAITPQLTGLRDIATLLRQFQHADLRLMIFRSVVIVLTPFVKEKTLPDCQIKF
jgi:hypothetical protein